MLEDTLSLSISVEADRGAQNLVNMTAYCYFKAKVLEISLEKALVFRRVLNEIYLLRLSALPQCA